MFENVEFAVLLDDAVHFSGEFPGLGRASSFGVDERRGELALNVDDG